MGRYDKYTQAQGAAPSGGSGRYAKYTTGRDDVISGYAGEILRRNEIYRTIPQEQLADPERLWKLAEREAERNGYKPVQAMAKQDKVSSFVTGYGQGGTFGFADELSGAVDFVGAAVPKLMYGDPGAAIDAGKQAYSDRVEKDRRILRQARVDNPYTTLGGELTGGIVTYAPAPAGWMGAGARTTGQVALQTAAKADKLDKIAKTANAARAAKLAADAAKLRTKAAALSMPAQTIGQATARFGSQVGESVVKGAGYGAAYGGVYGFGSGEGNAVERLDDAASGAAFGAAGGAILSPAAQFVLAPIAGRIGYGMFTSAENKALDNVLRRAERSGTSLKQVRDDFDRWAKTGEVPETLAEMMGPHERGLLSALISVNRETRERAAETFVGRGREEVNRLEDAFARSFGADRGDYAKAQAAAAKARVEDPEPLYAAAHFDQNGTLKPLDPQKQASLNNILADEDDIGRIVKDAAADLNRMGHKAARDEVRMYGEALQAARRGERVQIPQLSVQAADYIERAINQSYKAVGGGSGEISGSISGWRKLRNDVRAIIDDTGIGDARATSAERIRRGELLEEGTKIMSPTVDVDDVNRIMQGVPDAGIPAASDEGRKAYGVGAARAVANDLRQVPDMGGFADATRKVARTPALRDKLEAARPKTLTVKGKEDQRTKQTKANAALDEAIERASNRAQFGVDMVGNSKTAFRQGDVQDAVLDDALGTQIGESVSDLLMAGVGGASTKLRDRLARGIGNRIGQPSIYRPRMNRAMADILLATGDQIPVQVARLAARAANRKLGRITMRGLPPPPQGNPPTGKSPKPTGGAPVPPASPIRAGGFAGFGGKKPPAPLSNEQVMGEYERLLPRLDKALRTLQGTSAETVPGAKEALLEAVARAGKAGRGASDDQIIEEAWAMTRRRQQNGPNWPPRPETLEPVGPDQYMGDLSRMVSNKQYFEVDLETAIRESLTDLDDILAQRGLRRGDDMIPLDQLKAQLEDPRLRGADMTRPNGLAAGLKSDLGGAVGGALFSGAMPMEEDATLQDRLTRAGVGALLGAGGMRASRMLARQGADDLARTAGAGRAPKSGAEWGKVKQHNGQSVESATFGPENRGLELTISKDGEVAFTLYRQSVRPGDPSVEGAQELRQSLGKVIMALREHAQSVRAKPYYTFKANEPKKADIYRKLLARETGDGLQFYETPDGTFVVTKKSKFEVEKRFGPVRAAAQATSPQQAAKYETPGSPEWEAAKAKGLDMSQAGRMARAKEMGFDKDVYHATDADITEFDSAVQELGTHVGGKRAANDRAVDMGSKSIMPLKIRGKYVGVPDMRDFSDPFLYLAKRGNIDERFNAPAVFLKDLDREAKRIADGGLNGQMWNETNRAASKKPWGEAVREVAKRHNIDGFRYMNRHEGKGSLSYVVFDPSNIRSVNAAFDPDKAASPILTAGFGNFDITAPGQQIAKGLRAIDRRVRSARDPRIVGPLVKDLPQRGSNVPAIEQMPDRNKALSVLSDAIYAARSAERLGGQRGALGRGIKNKIGDYARSVKDRRAASEVVSLPARRARDTWAKAQQDYQDAWARYMSLRDARAPQSDLETAAKEVARLDALRQTLKAKIPVQALPPDPAMSELVRRAARIADSGMRNYRPLRPSRRLLEMYDEAVDLLTNPRRLADARMASQAKPLGSHEKAGQAIAGVGAVGGGGYLAYRQYEKDRR